MPSMWGQSEPKMIRSAPMSSTSSSTSSSQNGLTQMWRRNVSTGSSAKKPGQLARRGAQLAEEVAEELRPVLHRRDAEVGEACEQLVEDERREEVVDRPLHVQHLHRRPVGPFEGGREAVGRVAVRRVAAVARVDDHGDPGFVGARPEGVEGGVCRWELAACGVGAAGRMQTTRASWSSARSSSPTAASMSASEM